MNEEISAMRVRLYSTGFVAGFVVGCTFVVGIIVLVLLGA